MTAQFAIYPGCSLEGSSSAFETSLEGVLRALQIEPQVLKDWNCCGATSAHAMDHHLHLGLNLRNLALVRSQGFDQVVAPCAACYHRLATANIELREDAAVRDELNAEGDLKYDGDVEVRNLLDMLANEIGVERIAAGVKQPLKNTKVACYYGCLNTRVPRQKPYDDVEYPMAMDRIVEALGATPIDWSYKTECCGASLFLTSEEVSFGLVGKILRDAEARGADCIVVACPLCQSNLDTRQDRIREQFGIKRALPVVFITQLMGLAMGVETQKLELRQNFVPLELEKSSCGCQCGCTGG